jgi:hypothetical protein
MMLETSRTATSMIHNRGLFRSIAHCPFRLWSGISLCKSGTSGRSPILRHAFGSRIDPRYQSRVRDQPRANIGRNPRNVNRKALPRVQRVSVSRPGLRPSSARAARRGCEGAEWRSPLSVVTTPRAGRGVGLDPSRSNASSGLCCQPRRKAVARDGHRVGCGAGGAAPQR